MKKRQCHKLACLSSLYFNAAQTPGLRSLDSLFLGFATAVVGWSFAMIGFFDFMSWLCHGSFPGWIVVSDVVFGDCSVFEQGNRNNGGNFVKGEKPQIHGRNPGHVTTPQSASNGQLA